LETTRITKRYWLYNRALRERGQEIKLWKLIKATGSYWERINRKVKTFSERQA
jgi:hypothetical protein